VQSHHIPTFPQLCHYHLLTVGVVAERTDSPTVHIYTQFAPFISSGGNTQSIATAFFYIHIMGKLTETRVAIGMTQVASHLAPADASQCI
jgi:hypothetical protein